MKSIRDVSKPNSANGICCTIKKKKNTGNTIVGNESKFVLKVFQKVKGTKLTFCEDSVTVL